MVKSLTFEEFRDDPMLGNAWVKEPGLAIYVRKVHLIQQERYGSFVLASLTAKRPGKGRLTAFLDRFEASESFTFENVMNLRLVAYLARRGYVIKGDPYEYPPQMRRGFEKEGL